MHHLEHVGHRRILADTRSEQHVLIPRGQPLPNQLFRSRTERFPSRCPRPHDLNVRAQHPGVVDHLLEHDFVQARLTRRQPRAQQCRHVLHVRVPPRIERRARDELGLDTLAQLDDSSKLLFRGRVEGAAETSGSRVLCQRLLRGVCVGGRLLRVHGVGLGQQLASNARE